MSRFSEYKERCAISEELMKNSTSELGLILIRLVTYMEIGNHPDRETFWTYLENICKEKRHGQMVLDQLDTASQNETIVDRVVSILDKHITKV